MNLAHGFVVLAQFEIDDGQRGVNLRDARVEFDEVRASSKLPDCMAC
jgi:glutaredoxin-related protein